MTLVFLTFFLGPIFVESSVRYEQESLSPHVRAFSLSNNFVWSLT